MKFLDPQTRLSVYILASAIHGIRVHYGTGKLQLWRVAVCERLTAIRIPNNHNIQRFRAQRAIVRR